MLKIGTEHNLAGIGTTGHNRVKLQKLTDFKCLIAFDVVECPETIAACVTSSAASSTVDLRAALPAVAVATAAYLPIADARANMYISETNIGHPSIFSFLLVWALIASLLLNVGQAYAACHRPRRRSSESASVSSIGVQSQCTYTRWHKTPRFHLLPSGYTTRAATPALPLVQTSRAYSAAH